MRLIHGYLHPLDGNDIPDGFLDIKEGRIAAIGTMETCPAGEGEVLDLQGKHVCPGFVDAHSHLGLLGDSLGFEADDCNESTDPCTPQLRAIDGVNPLDLCFREAREGGVTTVLTGPGSANPIAGQFIAIKTAGCVADEMVLKSPAAMKFALGENPKSCYNERHETPITRMGTAAIIRENLRKALEYRDKKKAAEEDEDAEAPEFDAKLEALVPVVEGRLPAHFHAHRADDIATAVRIAKKFRLDYVIVHGTQGHEIADYLGKEGARVITGPCIGDRSKPELSGMTQELPKKLFEAGVKVAVCTDHPETPEQYLPLCAAMAVKAGLPAEEALKAITKNAAEIAGIGDRVGTLTVGKDADLVVTDGHPLDFMSRVELVFINGNVAAGGEKK